MSVKTPHAIPQEGDYDSLRQRVVDTVRTIHPEALNGEALAAPESSAIIRVASHGVLRQLQEQGVNEAGTLAIQLDEAAAIEDLADLSYVIAGRYATAQGMREGGVDVNAQAQQRRMALLAGAAGETAVAIVSSVLRSDKLPAFMKNGRKAVADYRFATHNEAGATLLNGLLEQTEAAAAGPAEDQAA